MIKQLNKLRPLFSRRDKLKYLAVFGLMGVGALLEVVGIGAVPAFIATLAVPEEVRALPYADTVLDALGITTPTQLVVAGAIAFILIFAFRAAYLIFLSYVQIRMTEHHRVRIARKLFDAYMRAPYEFHLGRNTAELLRNVNSETKSIITGIINPLLTMSLNAMMTIGIIGVLVYATPWSALVAVVIVGGGGWLFLQLVRERMKRYGKAARTERKKSIQAVNQGLGGFMDARVLGVETTLIEDFHQSIARFARYNRFKQFVGSLSNPLLEFIAVAGLMLVVLAMVITGNNLQSMVPLLGLFGAAIVRLRGSVSAITGQASQLGYNMASVDAVVDDLKLLQDMNEKRLLPEANRNGRSGSPSSEKLPLRNRLQLEQVSYTYPNAEQPALRDINLSIEPGQSVGLVGATGSGKTTLVNVLLGLLAPQDGQVLVDGVNIHSDVRAWQNNLGYIPQNIFLLDDSIRRNVAFGVSDEDIDDDRVWNALYAAQIGGFVMEELPDGIDTFVGERGARLSGGQRQRVGLARAIYHNPDVLVMDEATSALDNETESLVMEALDNLKDDRTFIMIAHRLSTVKSCDQLFYLDQGRIKARGTYEELCAEHHDFRRMAQVA
jgi:ATP-binding cassette subfamily C protein